MNTTLVPALLPLSTHTNTKKMKIYGQAEDRTLSPSQKFVGLILAGVVAVGVVLGITSFDGADAYSQSPSGGLRNLQKSSDDSILDVVIVGAGWSGIGAARTLVDSGVNNIEVIEARDYVGGRCRTVDIGDNGNRVELGCQWIHGSGRNNPITQLAQQHRLTLARSLTNGATYSNVVGGSFPKRLDARLVEQEEDRDYWGGFIPYQAILQETTDRDSSLREIASRYERERRITGDRLLHLEHRMNSLIAKEYNGDLDELSLWWWDNDSEHHSDDERIIVEGYSALIEKYAEPVLDKISFESVVTSIDWSDDVSEVTYRTGSTRRTVRARNVIVTLPIGVLKSGDVSFSPQMPSRKRTAVRRLGSGSFVKATMSWDQGTRLPWSNNEYFIDRINSLDKTERWNEFYNNRPTLGTNSIVGIATGDEGRRVEDLSDAEIQDEIMVAFDEMFGVGVVPPHTGFLVSRWDADPYSQGAYSFHALGSGPADRSALAEAMGGKVYWAGEATSRDFFATTHGAVQSGRDAGAAVLARLRNGPVIPSPAPAQSVGTAPVASGDYTDTDWEDLPDFAVTILENLGYNEKRWNRDKTPSAIDKDWSELTSQQRADLGQLGFDAYSWDGTPPPNNQIPVPNPAPAPASSPLASGDYTDTDWEDLPDFARNILENLGYNENRWCDDDTPSAIDKDWSRLTSQQRADLGRLAFREGNW